MKPLLKQSKTFILIGIFVAIAAYWGFLQFRGLANDSARNLIGDIYGSLALAGGIFGLIVSKKWGGFRSLLGKSIIMLSIGLLLQEFGQLSYAYYVVVKHTDIPYPSIGDVGYFGSVIFYIYGAFLLSKVAGSSLSLRSVKNKFVALLLPLALLMASYAIFLKGYEFDWSKPLPIILDFGYPLGQAVYLSIALLALLLSRKILGGLMRPKIILILIALLIQYVSDFNFLYQNSHKTWVTAGYGDFLYFVSYLLMGLSLLNLSIPYVKADKSKVIPTEEDKNVG